MGLSSILAPGSIAKPGVCTSSTRPASPYEGQVIYETDTDKVLVWTGSAWLPPWNTAWGLVAAYKEVTTNQTGITTVTDVTGASFTNLQLYAGRKYMYHWQGLFQCASAAKRINILLSDGSTTFTQTIWFAHDNATDYSYHGTYIEASGTTTTVTRKLRVQQQDAATFQLTNSSTNPLQFMVLDVGPA